MPDLSRRSLLSNTVAAAALAMIGSAGSQAAQAAAPRPAIHPRADWARGLFPTGRLSREREGDVLFLLVHHTETPNGYRPEVVPARLRSMFDYHTGTKGWPDLAYNFLVDAHGGIWEGRQGSLAGPVIGDATGGSQGFAQLCCFIGDHTSSPPTPKAQGAMSSLLAWLAGRYDIDLAAGRTITFVSRGSNRWPKGTRVTTTPVAAHRDMSLTQCPGDAAYPLVQTTLLAGAQRLAGHAATPRTTMPQGGTQRTATGTPDNTHSVQARVSSTSDPADTTPGSADTAAAGAVPSPSATAGRTVSRPATTDAAMTPTQAQPSRPGHPEGRLPLVAAGLIGAGLTAGGVGIAIRRRESEPAADSPTYHRPT